MAKKINKVNTFDEETLRKEVAKLSKRANTRLRAIEGNTLTEASESYRELQADAYMGAGYMAYTKKGDIKFDTALKEKALVSLREEYRAVTDFLDSTSSSIKGIKERWLTPYKTHQQYREAEGKKPMDYTTFSRFFSDAAFEVLRQLYGTDEAVDMVEDLLEGEDNWGKAQELVRKVEGENNPSIVYTRGLIEEMKGDAMTNEGRIV